MFIAYVDPTNRRAGPNQEWYRWQKIRIIRETKAELLRELRTYGTPRYAIYRDDVGPPKKVGMIYTYTEKDNGKTYYYQNWVEIVEYQEVSR